MRLSALAASLTVVAACAAPPSRAELTTLDDLAQLPGAAMAEAERGRDGVVVGLHFDEPGARYDGFLWEAANAGADSVSLVWSWQQVDVRASEVERRSSETPADTAIVEAAQLATRLGLEVLMPSVRLDTIERGAWRGTLDPEDREGWWASYEASFSMGGARGARGCSLVVVGSELGSMEEDADRWRALISRVREVTSARLTYSANWDRVHHVRFWDASMRWGSRDTSSYGRGRAAGELALALVAAHRAVRGRARGRVGETGDRHGGRVHQPAGRGGPSMGLHARPGARPRPPADALHRAARVVGEHAA